MHYEYSLGKPDFTIENIDAVNVIRNSGYRYSYRNGRAKHGFIYVKKGILYESFPDSSTSDIEVCEGDVIFIPKGTKYTGIYKQDSTEIYIVQFDIASGSLPLHFSKPFKVSTIGAGELINSFFESEARRNSRHPFFYLSRIYDLLWQIDSYYSKVPAKFIRLQPALDELSNNFTYNHPVAFYSDLCNMSQANFRKAFKEYTGLSPIDYRNSLRLKKARVLMTSGEYNVSEASDICGFSNTSFFIRLYKKKFGTTPKKM